MFYSSKGRVLLIKGSCFKMENVKLKVIKPLMSFIYLITYYLSLKIVGLRLTHRGQFPTWCTVGIIQGLFIGRYPLKKKNVKKLFLVLKQILVRKFHFLTYFFVVLFLMLWFFLVDYICPYIQ